MTTINNQDDFLEALRNNPAWREAVRAQILGDELLQLPVRFDTFVQEFEAFAREQNAFVREQNAFVQEQRAQTANLRERADRAENDMGALKGDFARTRTVQDARNIAYDMGLEFVRTLSSDELRDMVGNTLPRDVGRSFRNADLVIEAADGADTRYIAMESPSRRPGGTATGPSGTPGSSSGSPGSRRRPPWPASGTTGRRRSR